jgi:hypothetical protein
MKADSQRRKPFPSGAARYERFRAASRTRLPRRLAEPKNRSLRRRRNYFRDTWKPRPNASSPRLAPKRRNVLGSGVAEVEVAENTATPPSNGDSATSIVIECGPAPRSNTP